MPRPKRERPKAKRLHDRVLIVEKAFDGAKHKEIAQLLGRSRQLVTKELGAMQAEWRKRAAQGMNALIEQSLARIEWEQAECAETWIEAKQAIRGEAEQRALELFSMVQDLLLERFAAAPIAWGELDAEERDSIVAAVGDAPELPFEAMREYGRAESRRLDLLGLRGEYQAETAPDDLPKPEDVTDAESAERLYRRVVLPYKPFSRSGKARGR